MNETLGCHYDIDEMMDAIQDHIAPLKGETAWGYTPAYFLSARYNLHRDYAEHYLDKGHIQPAGFDSTCHGGVERSSAPGVSVQQAVGIGGGTGLVAIGPGQQHGLGTAQP